MVKRKQVSFSLYMEMGSTWMSVIGERTRLLYIVYDKRDENAIVFNAFDLGAINLVSLVNQATVLKLFINKSRI